jgi:hypothetical protein
MSDFNSVLQKIKNLKEVQKDLLNQIELKVGQVWTSWKDNVMIIEILGGRVYYIETFLISDIIEKKDIRIHDLDIGTFKDRLRGFSSSGFNLRKVLRKINVDKSPEL